ncbi:dihydrodipicolinate synthase family protein [Terriglobus aquaticus]
MRLLQFLQARGIRSFALNGATGEYTRSSQDEVAELLRCVKSNLVAGTSLVLGVGGPDTRRVQELIDLGEDAGVDGYLVSVPSFFPLEQQDIVSFVDALLLQKPAYLYNLPAFTTAITPETSVGLVRSNEHIIGVKDSSGTLDTVRLLSREAPEASRIIGNDSALHPALGEGVCDGVVSGVGGVLPEMMQRLYSETSRNAISDTSQQLLQVLAEYIAWLGRFPVPWGLKLTAQYRGLFRAEFPLPFSSERRTHAEQFSKWLDEHRENLQIS